MLEVERAESCELLLGVIIPQIHVSWIRVSRLRPAIDMSVLTLNLNASS